MKKEKRNKKEQKSVEKSKVTTFISCKFCLDAVFFLAWQDFSLPHHVLPVDTRRATDVKHLHCGHVTYV